MYARVLPSGVKVCTSTKDIPSSLELIVRTRWDRGGLRADVTPIKTTADWSAQLISSPVIPISPAATRQCTLQAFVPLKATDGHQNRLAPISCAQKFLDFRVS
jgi:hypothetical protein